MPSITRAFMLKQTQLLCNQGYAVMVSGVTHTPLWAAEHLVPATLDRAAGLERAGTFHTDPRWAGGSTLGDYAHSGYSRGHMAPSADQADNAAQMETFALSNIVPQTAVLNEGIWARIERTVRDMTYQDGEIYVVTGPAFHGHPIPTIGESHVFVPSSTWKALYEPRRQRAGVYVCKNRRAHVQCDVVTVATLTRNTGIDPFPALPAQVKARFWRLPSPHKNRAVATTRPTAPAMD
ncbi:DNA/RNA non-specific endonuclease [Acetobacter sp. TBRC 12305]|uniref:DNA/RNA non-specific endonuclease n=2 Tax=Acetobacter garciniae TaxID=2817435 RepID=A0A939KS00_9PROT|nr:DNA/RNA non-specific endonuclease [Acetobacter garciniae]MBX0346256.1 DNA/RNA non-specific endonuclease [Acetobacter garciniae]